MSISVKNWAKFQHFKDRKPPWIKLYRDILDDKEWHKLDPVAAKALVSFWLIASEYDGELPDLETLAFRMRQPEEQIVAAISKLSHWLELPDISVISPRHHDAPAADSSNSAADVSDHQETEGETEKEEKAVAVAPATPRKRVSSSSADALKPEDVSLQTWLDWVDLRKKKKTTVSVTAVKQARDEAAKAGLTLEQFFTVWCGRGSQGLEASWITPSERQRAASAAPADPDGRAAIEAEGIAKGFGPWTQTEQWTVYANRVRGTSAAKPLSIDQLAALAAQKGTPA